MSQPPSPEDELNRHPEPDRNGLIAAPCWLKTPLFDSIRGGLVEVRMTG
jgi:hypothetical protein